VLGDDSKGYYNENAILYDDTNIEQMRSISKDALHRNVDLELLAADEAGRPFPSLMSSCPDYI
jgi:hypothetical protein